MEPTRCWAYNQEGTRCDKEAGHDERHASFIFWTDSECFTPGKPIETPAQIVERLVQQAPAIAAATEPSACVACKHMHKGGVCKCGCHEHIG